MFMSRSEYGKLTLLPSHHFVNPHRRKRTEANNIYAVPLQIEESTPSPQKAASSKSNTLSKPSSWVPQPSA